MFFECLHCHTSNTDNRRFCINCGERLGCPICGFINEDQNDFTDIQEFYCGGCGSRLNLEQEVLEQHETFAVAQGTSSNTATAPAPANIFGFTVEEIRAEVAIELSDENDVHIGSPKHLDQSELDDLFDV